MIRKPKKTVLYNGGIFIIIIFLNREELLLSNAKHCNTITHRSNNLEVQISNL